MLFVSPIVSVPSLCPPYQSFWPSLYRKTVPRIAMTLSFLLAGVRGPDGAGDRPRREREAVRLDGRARGAARLLGCGREHVRGRVTGRAGGGEDRDRRRADVDALEANRLARLRRA